MVVLSLSGAAEAYTYNANYSTTITGIYTYAETSEIVFSVANMPTGTNCAGPFFAIAPNVPTEQKQMMYSWLALAYAMKETVNIGYDGVTCYNGTWFWVARVG